MNETMAGACGGLLLAGISRYVHHTPSTPTLARLLLNPAARVARPRTTGELNIAEIGRKSAQLEIIESKLANQEFVAKAPAEVVEKNRRIADELRIEIDRLQGGTT